MRSSVSSITPFILRFPKRRISTILSRVFFNTAKIPKTVNDGMLIFYNIKITVSSLSPKFTLRRTCQTDRATSILKYRTGKGSHYTFLPEFLTLKILHTSSIRVTFTFSSACRFRWKSLKCTWRSVELSALSTFRQAGIQFNFRRRSP